MPLTQLYSSGSSTIKRVIIPKEWRKGAIYTDYTFAHYTGRYMGLWVPNVSKIPPGVTVSITVTSSVVSPGQYACGQECDYGGNCWTKYCYAPYHTAFLTTTFNLTNVSADFHTQYNGAGTWQNPGPYSHSGVVL